MFHKLYRILFLVFTVLLAYFTMVVALPPIPPIIPGGPNFSTDFTNLNVAANVTRDSSVDTSVPLSSEHSSTSSDAYVSDINDTPVSDVGSVYASASDGSDDSKNGTSSSQIPSLGSNTDSNENASSNFGGPMAALSTKIESGVFGRLALSKTEGLILGTAAILVILLSILLLSIHKKFLTFYFQSYSPSYLQSLFQSFFKRKETVNQSKYTQNQFTPPHQTSYQQTPYQRVQYPQQRMQQYTRGSSLLRNMFYFRSIPKSPSKYISKYPPKYR
jgi:hypothetical protein